jgi:hypothetical protein
VGANRRYDSNVKPTEPPSIKSDRLLAAFSLPFLTLCARLFF